MSVFELSGRKALVTGGAQGLGEGMARALADAGAQVMIADLQDASAVAKELGEGHAATTLDVSSDEGWEAAVAHTVETLGGLDILVNNAGIEITSLLTEVSADDVRRMLEVNVLGTTLGIKHGLRTMRPGGIAGQGGSIINVASVAATIAFPGIAVYSATKSAVDRLTRVAAMESGKLGYGVRVNCIYPGLVPTAMGAGLANDVAALGLFPSPEEAVGAVIELTPSGRLGRSRTWRTPSCSWPRTPPGSSPAPGCPSTAEWGCDHERQARRRLRRLRLHRPARLRVPPRLPRPVRRGRTRQGQAQRLDGLARSRHRDRRLRHHGRRPRGRRADRAVRGRLGGAATPSARSASSARRSWRPAWPRVSTTPTPPASRTG